MVPVIHHVILSVDFADIPAQKLQFLARYAQFVGEFLVHQRAVFQVFVGSDIGGMNIGE